MYHISKEISEKINPQYYIANYGCSLSMHENTLYQVCDSRVDFDIVGKGRYCGYNIRSTKMYTNTRVPTDNINKNHRKQ